jgi:hypothetical protein
MRTLVKRHGLSSRRAKYQPVDAAALARPNVYVTPLVRAWRGSHTKNLGRAMQKIAESIADRITKIGYLLRQLVHAVNCS